MKDENLQPQQEPKKDESKSIQGARKQNARVILWVICALYLLYLVSKLLKDLFAGTVATQGTKIMVIVASVIFTAVAVLLLVRCVRYAIASFKDSLHAMDEVEQADAAEELDEPEADEPISLDEAPSQDDPEA